MTRDFDDDDLRAALQSLTTDATSDGDAWEATSGRARRMRVQRRVVSSVVALAVVVGAGVAVGAARQTDTHRSAPAKQPTVTTRTTVPEAPVHLDAWPPTVLPGAKVQLTVINGSAASVDVCGEHTRVFRADGAAVATAAATACRTELVFAGTISHTWSWAMPDIPGRYRVQVGDLSTFVTVTGHGGEPTSVSDPGSTHTITIAGASTLSNLHQIQPSELVVLGGNHLAIAWTSACNQPAARVQLRYDAITRPVRDFAVQVGLFVGQFRVKDCVGEPSNWSTIIDLPRPLHQRWVLADGADGKAVRASTTRLRSVNLWPVGAQFLPGPWDAARQPLAVLGAQWNAGGVLLRPYDGCGHWASRPMVDGHEIYVQAFVPVPADGCAGYNPLPVLSFTMGGPGPFTVFGGRVS